MKKGDTVYISSSSGVEEGVVVTVGRYGRTNVRVDGEMRLRVEPATLHATREAAEEAVVGARAVKAEERIRSARFSARLARDSLSSAQFALKRALAAAEVAEANVAKADAAVVAAEAGAVEAVNRLVDQQFGPGVSVTLTETRPDGAEVFGLHHSGRLYPVGGNLYGGFGYLVVRP